MLRPRTLVRGNEQKQQLSVAYVHAVAARAGYTCQVQTIDVDSVDLIISASGKVHERPDTIATAGSPAQGILVTQVAVRASGLPLADQELRRPPPRDAGPKHSGRPGAAQEPDPLA